MPERVEHDAWARGESPAEPSPLSVQLPGRWFVAHTRARHEKALAGELTRYRIVNYLPLTQRVTRSAGTGRTSRSVVPVFPGYLFFNGTEEQRYLALTTNRVANVLAVPNQDQLLSELRQIERLLAGTAEFVVAERLNLGDWARIVAGPLVGLEGMVASGAERFRVHLNVTILGQSISVEVDRECIERIDLPSLGQMPYQNS